jgi:signal transduction histidine kinase
MTEATTPGTMRRIAAAYRDVVTARTWKRTAHLVLDLWVGIITFTVTVTLLVTTVSLVIVFPVAVVLAWITEWVVRVLGRAERYRLAVFLDVNLADPHRDRPTGNWWRRLLTRLRSGALWREVGHLLVLLPQGILFFGVTLAAWSVALTALTLPATIWAIPDHQVYVWSGVTVHGWVAGVLGLVMGLVLLPLVPLLVGLLAEADVALARLLLGPSRREALEGRVTQLTETRSRVVDAAEAERRRIERDLHDGAQQRLVALAMDLGRAQDKFDTDPEGARALVDDAHREAKQALVELRDLARGIHPAVLTDRGLDAALSAVAGRSPVPVRLSIDVGQRPEPTIEGIAYFVVCEALTNVAKHAGARHASVTVARRGTQLLIEVTDDGHGGADEATGSGLVGLRDRVEGVDGWLHLSSPVGGPTTLLVELPCAS